MLISCVFCHCIVLIEIAKYRTSLMVPHSVELIEDRKKGEAGLVLCACPRQFEVHVTCPVCVVLSSAHSSVLHLRDKRVVITFHYALQCTAASVNKDNVFQAFNALPVSCTPLYLVYKCYKSYATFHERQVILCTDSSHHECSKSC